MKYILLLISVLIIQGCTSSSSYLSGGRTTSRMDYKKSPCSVDQACKLKELKNYAKS